MGLRHTALATAAFLFACNGALSEEITVSSWGGYFEDTLRESIYPGFTKETGIEVKSIAQPIDEAWLSQLTNAARVKKAPADLSLVADEVLARGKTMGLWATLDQSVMPNVSNIKDELVRSDDGRTYAVGALAWYTTFATNTDFASEAPASWKDLWEKDWDNKVGLGTLSNGGLLEVAAVTYFGGYEIMQSLDGLEQVIAKVAELKPSVKLWYRDEGQFQQALETGELNAGVYYHDVTTLSALDGNPVRSTFPQEGAIVNEAYWIVPRDSQKVEAAQKFIDYMSRPDVQADLARNLGVAPTAKLELLDLSDEELAAVGVDDEPIRIQTEIHLRLGDWISEKYLEMISR